MFGYGDLDLRDIEITIPGPTRRITQSRLGSILSWQAMGPGLQDVFEQDDRLIWRIPSLKRGDHLMLGILTRENRIVDSDLSYTYVANTNLESERIAVFFVLVLIAIFPMRSFFRGHPT